MAGNVPYALDPFETYEDPFWLLDEKGQGAYPAIEELLWSPTRVEFLCDYLEALALFDKAEQAQVQTGGTPEAVTYFEQTVPKEEHIPKDLLETINVIDEAGLVAKGRHIDPKQIAALLRNPEALLYAHLRIAASDSPYWKKYQPAPPPALTEEEEVKTPEVLQARLKRRQRIQVNPLRAIAASLIIFVCLAGAGGGAYYLGRAPLIDQVNALLEQLGLRKPIETEGFVLTASDTLVLTAKINKRSIKQVVFRPLPGEEHVIYDATEPQDGIETVRAEKTFPRHGPWAGKKVTVSVQFIPFSDLPAELLPPVESLTRKRDILLAPATGVILDPASYPVRLDITEQIRVRGEDYDMQGMSLRDGVLYVLVRPVQEGGPWYVQNFGERLEVRSGQFFRVPCKFHKSAEQFDITALVVPPHEDPFPDGQTQVWTLPTTDDRLEEVRVTVIRNSPLPLEKGENG